MERTNITQIKLPSRLNYDEILERFRALPIGEAPFYIDLTGRAEEFQALVIRALEEIKRIKNVSLKLPYPVYVIMGRELAPNVFSFLPLISVDDIPSMFTNEINVRKTANPLIAKIDAISKKLNAEDIEGLWNDFKRNRFAQSALYKTCEEQQMIDEINEIRRERKHGKNR